MVDTAPQAEQPVIQYDTFVNELLGADLIQEIQTGSDEKSEKLQQLLELTKRGVQYAMEQIQQKYESPLIPEKRLTYHTRTHTEGVITRNTLLLKTLRDSGGEEGKTITAETILLGILEASFHDLIQDNVILVVDEKTGVKQRKRNRLPEAPSNERQSADALIQFLRENTYSLTPELEEEIRTNIEVTIPNFDTSGVFQARLQARLNIRGKTLALADLGEVGMGDISAENPLVSHDVSEHIRENDQNFIEENADIFMMVESGEKKIPIARVPLLKNRLTAYTEALEWFSSGRRQRFESEMSNFPDPKDQTAVRGLFRNFSDTQRAQEYHTTLKTIQNERMEKLKRGALREVLAEMGYTMQGVAIEGEIIPPPAPRKE